ncbi:hypothetical protein SAMN06265182_0900 [Persephonella hydrogeniphila]|uniref:Uncharacterized protein n=1 Tax=Persephonella hydrogeniphila TaxID=198703 RepID=A0A285NC86_9AQUI|nr:hypothetical protein [Persephonella hydrogeniphila]SNZ07060.1 hypothetical protein SAMN06265182_0900 [Persephonella hydrogeniphila]
MKVSNLLKSSLFFALSSSVLFFSCENNSESNAYGEGDYLAYSGSVYLISPKDPQSPVQVSSGNTSYEFATVSIENFEPSTKNYAGLHVKDAVWLENSVYTTSLSGKVDFRKRQISNLSNVCSFGNIYGDIVKTKKYYMVVKTKGSDNTCGTSDDKSFLINSEMVSTDNAIPLNGWEILTYITGGVNDPYIYGFLMYNKSSNSIQRCNTDLTGCAQLKTDVVNVEDIAINNNNGDIFLCIETSSGSTIFEFDGVSLTNRNVSCDMGWDYDYDNTAIYSLQNDRNLYKFPYNGSDWMKIYNGGDMDLIFNVADNYLILDNFTKIIGVNKNGNSSWDLQIPAINGANQGKSIFSIGNTVYLTLIERDTNGNIVDIRACKASEGQSVSCDNNSYWLLFTASVNGSISLKDRSLTVYKLLKVENVDVQGGKLGGVLYSLYPEDPSSKLQIGTVPQNFKLSSWGGVGRYLLLSGYDIQNNQYDIFFLDVDRGNSLKQITNTPNKSEGSFLVYF